MRARLLALVVAAVPAVAAAQEDEPTYAEPPPGDHVHVTAWGGTLLDLADHHPGAGHLGGEVAYAFEAADLGVLAEGYRLGDRATSTWSPVILGRFLQRFETRKGLEATFGFGIGAGRTDHWVAWYQVALGIRLIEGPIFIAGEVGFERLDLFRLAAGLGLRF